MSSGVSNGVSNMYTYSSAKLFSGPRWRLFQSLATTHYEDPWSTLQSQHPLLQALTAAIETCTLPLDDLDEVAAVNICICKRFMFSCFFFLYFLSCLPLGGRKENLISLIAQDNRSLLHWSAATNNVVLTQLLLDKGATTDSVSLCSLLLFDIRNRYVIWCVYILYSSCACTAVPRRCITLARATHLLLPNSCSKPALVATQLTT